MWKVHVPAYERMHRALQLVIWKLLCFVLVWMLPRRCASNPLPPSPSLQPMTEYFNRFQKILDRGFKMIVYMPSKFIPSLKIDTTRVTVRACWTYPDALLLAP